MNAVAITLPVIFITVLLFQNSNAGEFGIDVSSLTTVAAFQCLASLNYTYVIPRAWKVAGTPDTNCPQTVQNAWAGGMKNVDVYMFPCFNCGDPAGQVINATTYLAVNGANYTRFWLDVENTAYWSTNKTKNIEFFQGLLDTGQMLGLNLGIYSSASQWTAIMGDWTGGSSYPLWYPRYNNISNYDDFSGFGGWTYPWMKQYQQNTAICGAFVDFNWQPVWPTPSVTPTVSPSRTPSPSQTPSVTPSTSVTPSVTPTRTPSPSITPSPSVTPSSSVTPTNTPTASVTPSPSPSPSRTPSVTPSISTTPSISPSRTPSMTPTGTPSVTPYNLKHKTDGGVVAGVAIGAIGGGLLAAGGVIGTYLLVRKRQQMNSARQKEETDLASMSAALAVE